ncbi:hypothetical protein [Nocardia sp. NPDC050710]|uniref:hypothetical protein n=1 Tax=Nocardia sp. NPDC050710 TaxID=3157220 RepID=UPI0033E64831
MKSFTWTPTHVVFEDWNHHSKWKAAQSPVHVLFDDTERVDLIPFGSSRSLWWCQLIIRGRQPDPMNDLYSFTYDTRRDAKKIDDMQARIARGTIRVAEGLPGSQPLTPDQQQRVADALRRGSRGWFLDGFFGGE